ncbi:MAG: leucyl aminopeptidase [Chitinivibrionia bacterium]|nr:leucyl aminopeptidase [Chitinivibrionia bacterium]
MIETITLAASDVTGSEDVVIVPLFKSAGRLRGSLLRLDQTCASAISNCLSESRFTPDSGETLLIALQIEGAPKHLVLLGLGDRSAQNPHGIMRAAGNAAQLVKKRRFKRCHLLVSEAPAKMSPAEFVYAIVKGCMLALYTFEQKASKETSASVQSLAILSPWPEKSLLHAVEKARTVAGCVARVRDMVNMPGNEMTPAEMGRAAAALAEERSIHCRVLRGAEIKKLKMGAVIDVSKGSAQEPRFIIVQYNRSKQRLPLVCLIGKGVTFDSGGISIKPWEHMEEMKGDMAGGAVVINTIAAAARLRIPLRIVGLVPCVENMPGHTALKPGDIVTTHSGKTIEILSTDAEGRLILADALSFARTFDPSLIVDFATLTGACVIALGKRIAGVMGNDRRFVELIIEAGRTAGEPLWQLPLGEEFSERIKGDIADYKNYSGRDGSTMTAAALLEAFAGGVPWVHVDIAGPYWSDGSGGSYLPKGGTGFGVDCALRFLETLARDKRARKLLKK